MTKFREKPMNTDWSAINCDNNCTSAYNSFLSKYKCVYCECLPLKQTNILSFSRKPWVSIGLLMSIKKKSRLYKQYLVGPTPNNENWYKAYKNRLTHLVRIAKRSYYEKQLAKNQSNIEESWKILNKIINKSPTLLFPLQHFILVIIKRSLFPKQIADRFCHYFTNVGLNLAIKISNSLTFNKEFLVGNFSSLFYLHPVSECDINAATISIFSFKPKRFCIPTTVNLDEFFLALLDTH